MAQRATIRPLLGHDTARRPVIRPGARATQRAVRLVMSAKLIYVLSSFHMLFCAFYIHIHVKLIKLHLNLVL